MSADTLKARSRLGVASRLGDETAKVEARRDLAAAKLEQYIERVVAEAPPLTPAQTDRIATLLRGAAPPGERRSPSNRRNDVAEGPASGEATRAKSAEYDPEGASHPVGGDIL